MKHLTSQTGGRFTYIDDFLNLQELALAFSEVFTDCDNFIVSGCEVVGDTITSGLVYLNGKLRAVSETKNITKWPQYIYEVNSNKNVPYASGGEKVGREEWCASVGGAIPTEPTVLTNATPKYITVQQASGGLRMKDAWFGKYGMILDPVSKSQTVKGTVNFETVNTTGSVTTTSQYVVSTSAGQARLYKSGANAVLEGSYSGRIFQLIMSQASNMFEFKIDGTQLATISTSAITFNKPVSCSTFSAGSVRMTSTNIHNNSTVGVGELNINLIGYSGGTSYNRNTNIGDGKGNKIVTVTGASKEVEVKGYLSVRVDSSASIKLYGIYDKSNVLYQAGLKWMDSHDANLANFGFYNTSNNILGLRNYVSDIEIQGVNCVNIAPVIKEGGVLLSARYALQTTMATELEKKANANDVYTKTDIQSSYATFNGGLSQFISKGNFTAAQLRQQIGAISSEDIIGFAEKSKCLSDMATTDALKKTIRDNIGAASKSDITTISDTKWVHIAGTSLYARQIGKVVCIQGTMTTVHSGTAFTIPSNIAAPTYCVGISVPTANKTWYGLHVHGGSKDVRVTHCNACTQVVPISMTYMVD